MSYLNSDGHRPPLQQTKGTAAGVSGGYLGMGRGGRLVWRPTLQDQRYSLGSVMCPVSAEAATV